MENFQLIGEVIGYNRYSLDIIAISVSLEIAVDDRFREFGGPELFGSIPNEGPDLVGHFIRRCFEVCDATNDRDLIGHLIKVEFDDERIIGIASLRSDDFFYPAIEFEKLTRGEEYL